MFENAENNVRSQINTIRNPDATAWEKAHASLKYVGP
jgi:hypothetical protein